MRAVHLSGRALRPEEATPSVEACGLFIAEMAEPCGLNYINGPNTVTYFGLVMAN